MYQLNYVISEQEKPDDIIIIDLDYDSLWLKERPDYLADLVEKLAVAGQAKVIALDILFDDYKNPEPPSKRLDDLTLDCTQNYNIPYEMKLACIMDDENVYNVILAVQRLDKKTFSLPLPILQEAAWGLGYVDKKIDHDGIQRSFILFDYGENSIQFLSMPAAIAAYVTDVPVIDSSDTVKFMDKTIITDNKFIVTPYLSGPNSQFHYVNASKLWNNLNNDDYFLKKFKDKIVLIGSTSHLLGDLTTTPFTKFNHNKAFKGLMPGIEFLANCVNSLINEKYFKHTPLWLTFIVSLFLILLSLLSLLIPESRYSFVYTILLAAITLTASFVLFKYFYIITQTGTTVATMLLSIPLVYAYKYLKVNKLFGRYVSPDVANLIWKNRDQIILSGEKRYATVVFSDIRGFTSLSEKADPELILALLNEYFERMASVIYDNQGNLNKFIGDGLMILYGVPVSAGTPDQDAYNAVKSSILMLEEVKKLNDKWQNKYPEININIGIGIHSGEIIVGNIGSSKRLEYSALGDTVNLASRLEGLNKEYNTNIIVSNNTYEMIKDRFNFKDIGSAKVKGRTQEVNIFTIKNKTEE
jgi:adenylate cyclase